MANDNVTQTINRQLKERWTTPLIEAGYTVVPNAILLRTRALGLDPTDFAIIMHIASYWWSKEKLPFPSKLSLAKGIGVDPSTIRRRIARMEKGGLIKRVARKGKHGGNDSNMYDLSPLIKEATPYAQEIIEEIKERTRNKEARLAKKGKPKLVAVK